MAKKQPAVEPPLMDHQDIAEAMTTERNSYTRPATVDGFVPLEPGELIDRPTRNRKKSEFIIQVRAKGAEGMPLWNDLEAGPFAATSS
jgi:hypothetical protein